MFDPAEYDGPGRGWVRPCGAPGPYCIPAPTPRQPGRLVVLTCTRPESHGTPFHQYATLDRGVIAQWDRAGRPDYPPIMKVRPKDGASHSV